MSDGIPAIPVFVSYSHRNNDEQKLLCESLRTLPGVSLELWTDRDMLPGDVWEQQIDAALGRAQLAVLIVTTEFLNSRYVMTKELPRLLQRHREASVRVVPIIARSCTWNLQPWLADLQVLPTGGTPIWRDSSTSVADTLNDVAQAINRLLTSSPTALGASGPQSIPASLAERAGARLSPVAGALDALAELNTANAVTPAIAAFRDDFRNAQLNIALVTHYKRLHDELHTIHTRYYRQLVDNARWFPDEPSVCRAFVAVHADLQASVVELKRIEGHAPASAGAANWIRTVDQACTLLATANATFTPGPLQDAIAALGRVLRQEPGRLDINMNSAARDMNVRRVVRALRAVHGAMQRTDSNVRLIEDFLAGVDQLEALEREWSELVDLHRRWEEVESTLRLIDESIRALEGGLIGDPLAELRTQFSFLSGAVSKLMMSDGGDWLDALRGVHEKLDAALLHGDEGGSRNHYMSFRSLLGRRFENLDTELKNLCRDMASLGRRFDRLGA